ncbi:Putative deoxyribonuclease YjjV [Marinobacter nitratireducens]|uniref:Deoxyribonuclease YjjV n=1 Tax=Marinobacter nitratireducens TaxID=1137280 RepID=A0A072N2T6_9GAMM|nr:TatD family hydrolase [Marinobacter nitratireducens]KEF31253.1 Putative deoxyribonuclease YjjV [Marinobacter nitratireducens]
MRFVDAHCHFDFPRFDGLRSDELASARHAGMVALVIPGVRHADWSRVREVARSFPDVFYCLGIHPWYIDEHNDRDLDELARMLEQRPERCVGIGECGLDRLKGNVPQQLPWFEAQVDIAAKCDYPLIIHSVKTHDDVCSVLRRRGWNGRALLHGFSGSYEQARKLVDLGCYIGVGGVISHSRARKTREAISRLPDDVLVVETDAPDMAPEGVQKGRNSPVFLPGIIEVLAELRGTSVEKLSPVLLENVCRLYGWKSSPLRA